VVFLAGMEDGFLFRINVGCDPGRSGEERAPMHVGAPCDASFVHHLCGAAGPLRIVDNPTASRSPASAASCRRSFVEEIRAAMQVFPAIFVKAFEAPGGAPCEQRMGSPRPATFQVRVTARVLNFGKWTPPGFRSILRGRVRSV